MLLNNTWLIHQKSKSTNRINKNTLKADFPDTVLELSDFIFKTNLISFRVILIGEAIILSLFIMINSEDDAYSRSNYKILKFKMMNKQPNCERKEKKGQ